jgi:hypothetical protein
VDLFKHARSLTTSGFFVIPLLSQLWEENNYCERRNELSCWRPVVFPNFHTHLCLYKLGYEVLALLSSDIYILSGENLAGVYSTTRRRRDQNTTQVDSRQGRAGNLHVQEPLLLLDVSTLPRPVLHFPCLPHRVLSCTWTCLDKRSLCFS